MLVLRQQHLYPIYVLHRCTLSAISQLLSILNSTFMSLSAKAKKIDHFSQNPSVAVQKVEQSIVCRASKCPMKGELTKSALINSSLDHIIADDIIVEHIFMCFILSHLLSPKAAKNLNAHSKLLNYFQTMFFRMKLEIIYNSFQCDQDCASQTTMHMEHRMKFLFLVAINCVHVSSISW